MGPKDHDPKSFNAYIQEAILLIYSLVKAECIENISHPCFCVAVFKKIDCVVKIAN